MGIIGIKPAPGVHESNLRKWVQFRMGAIPGEPLKNVLNLDIIGIKPAPGDHESNLKKVVAIPRGCNTT